MSREEADGFVYKPLSQYDATQYSGNTLPGFESQAGEAAIFAMLLRSALGLPDTPKIENLFEPGKGFQWRSAKWENPMADKVRVSDGADRTGAPGESFPIQPGTTDMAAMLGKGPMILTGRALCRSYVADRYDTAIHPDNAFSFLKRRGLWRPWLAN